MTDLQAVISRVQENLRENRYPGRSQSLITGNGKKISKTVSTLTSRTKSECDSCGGVGWKVTQTGDLLRCVKCVNLLALSRLNSEEQLLTIDSVTTRKDDHVGEGLALRFLAKEMVRDPFGFLSIQGVPGNAKSLVLMALIAEFCRVGRQGLYLNADDLVSLLSPGDDVEVDGFAYVPGNPDANLNRLKRVDVLAIDEMDKIKWSGWQVQKVGALIEHRHRNAKSQVTLFAMNRHPDKWKPENNIDHLIDRWMDGRFNRYWPQDKTRHLPACLEQYKDNLQGVTRYYAPGFFQTKLPSMRKLQRRTEIESEQKEPTP